MWERRPAPLIKQRVRPALPGKGSLFFQRSEIGNHGLGVVLIKAVLGHGRKRHFTHGVGAGLEKLQGLFVGRQCGKAGDFWGDGGEGHGHGGFEGEDAAFEPGAAVVFAMLSMRGVAIGAHGDVFDDILAALNEGVFGGFGGGRGGEFQGADCNGGDDGGIGSEFHAGFLASVQGRSKGNEEYRCSIT